MATGTFLYRYEEAVRADPYLYDTWFDYVRLEEEAASEGTEADFARVRDVYERAISNVPPAADKRLWRRYIYLWLRYAIFEELTAKDVARARAVCTEARRIVPHKHFTFAKLWIHAAHLEVRQGALPTARKLLGAAIGRCPKEKLFKEYAEMQPRCSRDVAEM
jgi:crooked neck